MYEPYYPESASATDRVAWTLCQIIDDDAPMRWTRYRFAAQCIATNGPLISNLECVREETKREYERQNHRFNRVGR